MCQYEKLKADINGVSQERLTNQKQKLKNKDELFTLLGIRKRKNNV